MEYFLVLKIYAFLSILAGNKHVSAVPTLCVQGIIKGQDCIISAKHFVFLHAYVYSRNPQKKRYPTSWGTLPLTVKP